MSITVPLPTTLAAPSSPRSRVRHTAQPGRAGRRMAHLPACLGARKRPHLELRFDSTGVVVEHTCFDTVVPWSQFNGLAARFDGTEMTVWLHTTDGEQMLVPGMRRTGLMTEGARSGALAAVNARLACLRREQAERAFAPVR